MSPTRLAQWMIFDRLYVRRMNAFMGMCPIVFRDEVESFGVLCCEVSFRRKRWVVFELVDDMMRPEELSEIDGLTIRSNRKAVMVLLYKISSLYRSAACKAITEREAMMLAEWLGVSNVGSMIPLQLERNDHEQY